MLLDDRLSRQPLGAAGTTLRGLWLVLELSGVASAVSLYNTPAPLVHASG